MFPTDGRPGDERAFVHKKLLGGISKLAGFAGSIGVPGAGFVSGVTGRLAGVPQRIIRPPRAPMLPTGFTPRPTLPRSSTARVTVFSKAEKLLGQHVKFPELTTGASRGFRPGRGLQPQTFGGVGPSQRGPCDFPNVRDPDTGMCRTPTSGEFGGPQFEVGEAVMGRYGAALEPGSRIIDRAICLRGMQLANDGLCYNKGQITNKQRMWPAGRKPLLTGGDMRCISVAARAGRRMELATKRLQKMGMMKKPARRTSVPAGHTARLEH